MNWGEVWKIVLSALAAVGGIGGLIIIVIKYSSNIIAERLSKKYDLKLTKEIEKFKSSLDSKIYISKTKFDTEFSIYRELSKTFFEMVKDISILIPNGVAMVPSDENARKEYEGKIYSASSKSVVCAQDALNSNAPFIPNDFFIKYSEILQLSNLQLHAFDRRWNVLYFAPQSVKETLDPEDYARTDEINRKFNDLNTSIREYLSKLDVLN